MAARVRNSEADCFSQPWPAPYFWSVGGGCTVRPRLDSLLNSRKTSPSHIVQAQAFWRVYARDILMPWCHTDMQNCMISCESTWCKLLKRYCRGKTWKRSTRSRGINNIRDPRKLAVFNLKNNNVLLIPPVKTALEEHSRGSLPGDEGATHCCHQSSWGWGVRTILVTATSCSRHLPWTGVLHV